MQSSSTHRSSFRLSRCFSSLLYSSMCYVMHSHNKWRKKREKIKKENGPAFFLLELNSTLYYITIIFPARSLLMSASPFFFLTHSVCTTYKVISIHTVKERGRTNELNSKTYLMQTAESSCNLFHNKVHRNIIQCLFMYFRFPWSISTQLGFCHSPSSTQLIYSTTTTTKTERKLRDFMSRIFNDNSVFIRRQKNYKVVASVDSENGGELCQ